MFSLLLPLDLPEVALVSEFDEFPKESYVELKEMQKLRGYQNNRVEPALGLYDIAQKTAFGNFPIGSSGSYILISKLLFYVVPCANVIFHQEFFKVSETLNIYISHVSFFGKILPWP